MGETPEAALSYSGAQVIVPEKVDLALPRQPLDQVSVPADINGVSLVETELKYVSDVMKTSFATISPTDSAQSAARLMADLDIDLLPVVAPGVGITIGTVRDRDLVKAEAAVGRANTAPILDFMRPVELACAPTDELRSVVDQMKRTSRPSIVVLDAERHAVGILTRSDAEGVSQGA